MAISYMHFHPLYCPLCTIITIICLIMTMLIKIILHLTSRSLIGYIPHLCWLFTIIECLQHACVWTTFSLQEVVLEYTILSISLRTIHWANYFWAIILDILHESSLCIIHRILWWMLLFVRIVKSRSSCVWSSAETALVHLILFILQHYTVVLLMTITCFKWSINSSGYWSTTIRELSSCLFVWLI